LEEILTTYAYLSGLTLQGTINTLPNDDDLWVGPGAHLVSQEGTAIVASGSYHSFVIDGSVQGGFQGLQMGNSKFNVDQFLTVHAGGEVIGKDGQGAVLTGTHSLVNNAGTIHGGTAALEINAIGAGTASHVVNTGTIWGADYGVTHYSSASTETLVIDNSGIINGSTASFDAMGSNAVEIITNTGKMYGDVNTGGGNDYFDTSKGIFDGSINMGAGNDTVKGNALKDFIYGGTGRDLMTGNGGADHFEFSMGDSSASAPSADRITDFSHAQHDLIDFFGIDAKPATSQHDPLHWIGTQAFHHVAGELNYKVVGGNALVQIDMNGDGASDMTIQLDHVTSLVKGDFFL